MMHADNNKAETCKYAPDYPAANATVSLSAQNGSMAEQDFDIDQDHPEFGPQVGCRESPRLPSPDVVAGECTPSEIIQTLQLRLQETRTLLRDERAMASRSRADIEAELSQAHTTIHVLQARVKWLEAQNKGLSEKPENSHSDLGRIPTDNVTKPVMKIFNAKEGDIPSESAISHLARSAIETPKTDVKVRRAAKRKAVDRSMPGEKSLFSITPLLPRIRNINDGQTPALLRGEAASHGAEVALLRPFSIVHIRDDGDAKTDIERCMRDSSADFDVTLHHDSNLRSAPAPHSRPKSPARLDSKQAPEVSTSVMHLDTTATNTRKHELAAKAQCEPRKKKRKFPVHPSTTLSEQSVQIDENMPLVTLFEQQPTLETSPSADVNIGANRKRVGHVVLGPGDRESLVEPAFSPLKRDRRGAGASFLI
jgi:hypothetical protein